jgi:uncharacterized protein
MKAAKAGDTSSQFQVGYRFHEGIGVRPSPRHSVAWYRRAARGGDPAAHFNLYLCYKNGDGVAANSTRGRYHLKKAADLGMARAKRRLAK